MPTYTIALQEKDYIVQSDGHWWGGYTFSAPEAAQLVANRLTALEAYGLYALPSGLTREQYETECKNLNVECLTDSDCTSYAVRFGEFNVLYNNAPEIAKFHLAHCRLNAIIAEQKATKKDHRRTPPELVQADCGHQVPRTQLMSTSIGTSCPDCYDRMSN